MITVYARYEPTTDAVYLERLAGLNKKRDVVIYRDAECTEVKARFSWHFKSKPTRRSKRVMLNCYQWALEWVKP